MLQSLDAVIPYMSNQGRGEDVLRVDRRFWNHGPEEMVARYHRRPLVESAYSFLKDQYARAWVLLKWYKMVLIQDPSSGSF